MLLVVQPQSKQLSIRGLYNAFIASPNVESSELSAIAPLYTQASGVSLLVDIGILAFCLLLLAIPKILSRISSLVFLFL